MNELVLHRRPGWGRWNAAAARGAVPRHRPGHRGAHLPRESRVNRGSSLGARAFADGEQREKQDIVEEPTSWQKVIGVEGGGGGRVGFWPNVGKGAFGCHLRGSAVAGLPFYDVVVCTKPEQLLQSIWQVDSLEIGYVGPSPGPSAVAALLVPHGVYNGAAEHSWRAQSTAHTPTPGSVNPKCFLASCGRLWHRFCPDGWLHNRPDVPSSSSATPHCARCVCRAGRTR